MKCRGPYMSESLYSLTVSVLENKVIISERFVLVAIMQELKQLFSVLHVVTDTPASRILHQYHF